MQTRELGTTGVRVSIIGIGGYHLGIPSPDEATRIIRAAVDGGVTFLDNCWDYWNGESEKRMGNALRDGYRNKVFLMTKLDGRTAQSTREQLEQSLRHLQTDVIDLVQIHEVIREDDPARCFAPGGAIEALLEARKAGKLRFIGFTGHKHPRMHRSMIETARKHGFRFDSVQMPLNVLDAHWASFEREVLPLAVAAGMAVLGMKPMGAGLILESGVASPLECLHYAMSVPGVSLTITGCENQRDVEQALRMGRDFKPLSADEKRALLARTAAAAQDGQWEKFKSTGMFDGTEQNRHWLTEARY